MAGFRLLMLAGTALSCVQGSAVSAGEAVLYQPVPEWVVPGDVPDNKQQPGKPLRFISSQVNIDDGQVWHYQELVFALTTPEYLTQMSTVTAQWLPDKGDLMVHRVELRRGDQVIDVLGQGATFDVLRREQLLEQKMLNGARTATLNVPGVQVGDQLRVAYSTTTKDQALGDEYEWAGFILANPAPLVDGTMHATWPADEPVRYRATRHDGLGTPVLKNGQYSLTIDLPIDELDEMPHDAPSRYNMMPVLQLSSFADWNEVSATMAPHFQTAGTVPASGPIKEKVATIQTAHKSDLARAAAALQVVQDEISYLFNGMEGGNYLPQSPSQTWEKRFGDCKAKSLLLLAMLREMQIEGDVALVLSQGGDAIPEMLPMPGAFDHMIVRAQIDGQTYWLDGTSFGTRLANIGDAPRFIWALPVTEEGSGLVPIPARAIAQPLQDMRITLDHRAGAGVPALFEVELRTTGPAATMYRQLSNFEAGEQKDQALNGILQQYLGANQNFDTTVEYIEETGTAIVRGKGIMTTPWEMDEGQYRLDVPYQPISYFGFDNDRAREAWRDVPVSINGPYYARAEVKLLLPEQGEGYRLLGKTDIDETIGRNKLVSTASLAGDTITLRQEVMNQDWELPADELAQTKRDTARLLRSLPRVVAPTGTRQSWEYGGKNASKLASLEKAYQRLIAEAEGSDADVYINRAAFRSGTGNWSGALADYDEAMEREASANLYRQRAYARYQAGDRVGALADLEEADGLEPDGTTYHTRIEILGELGRGDEAVALAQEYAGFASDIDEADALLANAYGWAGRTDEGAAIFDRLVVTSPNNPSLLNGACWFAATWNHEVAAALPQCDRAVEVGANAVAALDSRALAHFRMGQTDKALADLDTALASAPALHESRYLRGIIRVQNGDKAGHADMEEALFASPSLKEKYRHWGLGQGR